MIIQNAGNNKRKEIFHPDWSKFNQENFVLDYLDDSFDHEEKQNPDNCFNTVNTKMQELVSQILQETVNGTKKTMDHFGYPKINV